MSLFVSGERPVFYLLNFIILDVFRFYTIPIESGGFNKWQEKNSHV